MLQMAVPNKGALSESAVSLLKEAGYRCSRYGRELIVSDHENEIDFVFLRPRDIALYVGRGIIDLGVTGRDLYTDSLAEVEELMPLNFGKSRFCFAAPKGKYQSVKELNGLRIATSYPELLKLKLAELGMECPVVKLDGAVEISVQLGVADAISDVVESGSTLREAGLEIIGEPMLYSEAVLIGRNKELLENDTVNRLIGRIHGIQVAASYAMIEHDVPRSKLETCCRITPGLESPTVSPLADPDWVAVKAMISRKEANKIMDELFEEGTRGIIITDLRSCRL
jgi:ATP phosphoribosyltransferase